MATIQRATSSGVVRRRVRIVLFRELDDFRVAWNQPQGRRVGHSRSDCIGGDPRRSQFHMDESVGDIIGTGAPNRWELESGVWPKALAGRDY
jgi:hypothetical protein